MFFLENLIFGIQNEVFFYLQQNKQYEALEGNFYSIQKN